ncbi:hypothetical protein HL42_6900 [Trichophyton rubrum]|nr:hypothetical protein HL42_6900 [Trichophyton rubrum]
MLAVAVQPVQQLSALVPTQCLVSRHFLHSPCTLFFFFFFFFFLSPPPPPLPAQKGGAGNWQKKRGV